MNSPAPRVLVIEDETALQQKFKSSFETSGFTVTISPNGMEGIMDVLTFHPDVILLDLMMPQVDGYEVISAIRNNSDIKTPIIVYSSLTDPHSIRQALDLGANEYLPKPKYAPAQVVREVQRIVKKDT